MSETICHNCQAPIRRTGPDHPWYHVNTGQEQCGPRISASAFLDELLEDRLTLDKIAGLGPDFDFGSES